jgi:hypothetical protein
MRVSYLAQYESERAEEFYTLPVSRLWSEAADALQLQLLHLSHSGTALQF